MKGDSMSAKANAYKIIYPDEESLLSPEDILTNRANTAEFAILVYILFRAHSSKQNDDQSITIWDILLRFPEDNPVDLALAVKRLAKTNYHAQNIDVDLVEIIEQKYNVDLSR
jgi:hypothetical protein